MNHFPFQLPPARATPRPSVEVDPMWKRPAGGTLGTNPPVDPCLTFSSIALETPTCNFALQETGDRIDLEA